jgi:hypothetical protein
MKKLNMEWFDSPEGQKSLEDYINKLAEKDRIMQERIQKIKQRYNVCDDATFDDLMLFIFEKQEKYDKKHWKTYTDRPLHVLNLMFELASSEGTEIEPIDDLTENFPSMVYDYLGYQFAITHGQGSVLSVYRQKDLRYRS